MRIFSFRANDTPQYKKKEEYIWDGTGEGTGTGTEEGKEEGRKRIR